MKNSRSLRTALALKVAPWLRQQPREWTITGPGVPFMDGRERYSEEELLAAAFRAQREGHAIAASGCLRRVQALREGLTSPAGRFEEDHWPR